MDKVDYRIKKTKLNIYWCNSGENCLSNKDMEGSGIKYISKNVIKPLFIKQLKEAPLTNIGIQQAIFANLLFFKYQKNLFDRVYCSSLTSDVMTALFSMRNTEYKNIYIIPYINETFNNDSTLLKKKLHL